MDWKRHEWNRCIRVTCHPERGSRPAGPSPSCLSSRARIPLCATESKLFVILSEELQLRVQVICHSERRASVASQVICHPERGASAPSRRTAPLLLLLPHILSEVSTRRAGRKRAKTQTKWHPRHPRLFSAPPCRSLPERVPSSRTSRMGGEFCFHSRLTAHNSKLFLAMLRFS